MRPFVGRRVDPPEPAARGVTTFAHPFPQASLTCTRLYYLEVPPPTRSRHLRLSWSGPSRLSLLESRSYTFASHDSPAPVRAVREHEQKPLQCVQLRYYSQPRCRFAVDIALAASEMRLPEADAGWKPALREWQLNGPLNLPPGLMCRSPRGRDRSSRGHRVVPAAVAVVVFYLVVQRSSFLFGF